MKSSSSLMLTSTVTRGMVPMPRGLNLAEGATVLVLPLEWMSTALAAVPPQQHSTSKAKHRFASEDLIGCYEGDGIAVTNGAVRSRLRQRAQHSASQS